MDMQAKPLTEQVACFHCGEHVPDGLDLTVTIDNIEHPMCCYGCQAVAQTIIDSGLQAYYQHRTSKAVKADIELPETLRKLEVYDAQELQTKFTEQTDAGLQRITLLLDDITCAACCWLIETRLNKLAGIEQFVVNYSSHRAQVEWNAEQIHLSDILKQIVQLGYRAYPYDSQRLQAKTDAERKQQLRRLGLAGLFGMQVMMLAIALYMGDWSGMETQYRTFFYWLSLLLTTPVVLYAAQPFYKNAWRDLRSLRVGMDVPVALAISIAFIASIFTTITHHGHIYFDSIVMFVFLLLLARYLEFNTRQQANHYLDSLCRIIPVTANRIHWQDNQWQEENIPVTELAINDRLLIRPGEMIPVDGVIVDGQSSVDESVLTGESIPVGKQLNDHVMSGSTNVESALHLKVSAIGEQTRLAQIIKLLERGQMQKPVLTAVIQRVAGWFVATVLLLASASGAYWWLAGSEQWLSIMIAVLVVTCPCALSLATPTALTAAMAAMMKRGMAVLNSNAIQSLANTSLFVFDKTGTLTTGELELNEILLKSHLAKNDCLAIAKAMEQHSEHPIAKAFYRTQTEEHNIHVEHCRNHPGQGVSGDINGISYYLGTARFIRAKSNANIDDERLNDNNVIKSEVYLADANTLHAVFLFKDALREQADALINTLQNDNYQTALLSGDKQHVVEITQHVLKIDKAWSEQLPQDKLDRINTEKANGNIITMIGDGINDAPVLAASHVSIAMGNGTDLAKLNADMILLNNNLNALQQTIKLARQTLQTIKQNISWALLYNLIALPAAMTGWLQPWMAAIGMSLSSLIVVSNSARLGKRTEQEH